MPSPRGSPLHVGCPERGKAPGRGGEDLHRDDACPVAAGRDGCGLRGPSRLQCAQRTGAVGLLPHGCMLVGRGAPVCVYIGPHPGLLPGRRRKSDRLSICTTQPRGESAGPRARATFIAVPPTTRPTPLSVLDSGRRGVRQVLCLRGEPGPVGGLGYIITHPRLGLALLQHAAPGGILLNC